MYRIKQITETNLLGEVKSTYYIVQKHVFLIGWINVTIPALLENSIWGNWEEDIELRCNTLKKAEEIIKYLERKHEYRHNKHVIREVHSMNENRFVFLIPRSFSKNPILYSFSLDGVKKYIDEKTIVKKTIIYE